MERITVSRPMVCPHCKERGSPKQNETVVLFGSTRWKLYYTNVHGGTLGITPHLIDRLQVKKDTVVVRKTCGIEDCGVTITRGKSPVVTRIRSSIVEIPLKEWNALVQFTDTGLEVT